jgi:DNA repair protein RecO (recombination protein O)
VAARVRRRAERFRSDALLVRRVAFGEADVIATFFTAERGLVGAVARSARRSTKRFAALEPMHLLAVTVDERPGSELGSLVEASLVRPRLGLAGDLERLDAAGRALRWLRRAAPPHTPEPAAWRAVNALLDALDAPPESPRAGAGGPTVEGRLAATGLSLLGAVGWGLDFERCVRCGRPAGPDVVACLGAAEGGLVCRACGGAGLVLRPDRRARLAAAAAGDLEALEGADARVALDLVDAALAAHAGLAIE